MSNVRSVINTFEVSSDELVREISKLYRAAPNQYALISLIHTQGLDFQKEPEGVNVNGKPIGVGIVHNPKFEQHLDEIEEDEVSINCAAGYSSSATSIVVSDGALIPKYALLYVPRTGEILRVSSISSHTVTATRAESGTTAAALVHGDQVMIHAAAYAENALSDDPRFKQTSFPYNYTQIDREPFGESRTSAGSKYHNGVQSYDERKKLALISFLRRFNGTLWLGGRAADTSNQFRTTGGIIEFIDSGNVMDLSQNLTRADFDYFCRKMLFAYNSNRKTLFCGSRLLEKVDGWANDKSILKEENTLNQFGMAVKSYRSRYGIIDLVWEPYFDKMTAGTTPLNTYGVGLDLPLIKLNYLSNGVLQSRDDIQENDRDGRKGEWLMEAGVEVNCSKAQSIIRGC